jgi:hypothetical protein
MNPTYGEFRDLWARKTVKQIEREIESMRKYMQRHRKAYSWHGSDMKATDELSDGSKLCALRDALEIAKGRATGGLPRQCYSCGGACGGGHSGKPCQLALAAFEVTP